MLIKINPGNFMISEETLKELTIQKLIDADVLQNNGRYDTSVYIAGYALELSLKLKICKFFKFEKGFPENKYEFNVYQNTIKSQTLLAGAITQIKDIRHHELDKLLFFSGVEYKIKLNFLTEWNLAIFWKPEMRYHHQNLSRKNSLIKIDAIKILVQNLL